MSITRDPIATETAVETAITDAEDDDSFVGSAYDFTDDPATTGTLEIADERDLGSGSREMTLNMGPQHPSTHGYSGSC